MMRHLRRPMFVALLAAACGCGMFPRTLTPLPTRYVLERQQLVFYSDAPLPKQHRIFEDLDHLRDDIVSKLELPQSEEPIYVYLFSSQEALDSFLKLHYPGLPPRRAIFVESDTRLAVYAHWGDRVAEDLRHEVAHGYLHAVVPNLPLWLDEGLAEYFEVARGGDGLNVGHVEELAPRIYSGWRPDLERLETLTSIEEMDQYDYAEAWAWVHFLFNSSAPRRQLLLNQLQALRKNGGGEPLSVVLRKQWSNPSQLMFEHLNSCVELVHDKHE